MDGWSLGGRDRRMGGWLEGGRERGRKGREAKGLKDKWMDAWVNERIYGMLDE